jgi:hypothetical protein
MSEVNVKGQKVAKLLLKMGDHRPDDDDIDIGSDFRDNVGTDAGLGSDLFSLPKTPSKRLTPS